MDHFSDNLSVVVVLRIVDTAKNTSEISFELVLVYSKF